MTDRLADECHGYDLDGYPIGDGFDCPPAIAAKLDRCNEVAHGQHLKSQGRLRARNTDDDQAIHRRNVYSMFYAWRTGRRIGRDRMIDAGAAYLNSLNA